MLLSFNLDIFDLNEPYLLLSQNQSINIPEALGGQLLEFWVGKKFTSKILKCLNREKSIPSAMLFCVLKFFSNHSLTYTILLCENINGKL